MTEFYPAHYYTHVYIHKIRYTYTRRVRVLTRALSNIDLDRGDVLGAIGIGTYVYGSSVIPSPETIGNGTFRRQQQL